MAKSVKKGFGDTDIQLEPPSIFVDISNDIQQTIARLFGWNETQERFLLLNADNDGRLLVSQSTTKTDTGTLTRITLTGSTQLAIATNDFRRAFRLINTGATSVQVGFITPITTSYFTLVANGTYFDDIYSGNVYINGTASNIVEVIEL